MVLFTSGSLLTWGNLQALHLASPPGIHLLSTLNNSTSHVFTEIAWWLNMHFLPERQRGGGRIWCLYGGVSTSAPTWTTRNSHVIPLGNYFSISSLKIWGDIQEPHNNMVYLLVHTGDTLEARNYGISLVWVNPNQVQASTMEEAVGTLFAYISSGPDWPYALA